MRKRLRRKRHIGEFREDGFEVKFNLNLDSAGQDVFLNGFILFIESIGLVCGGGCGASWDIFITKGQGSVIESERQIIFDWLKDHPNVSNLVIGELVDAWWCFKWL